MPRNSARPAAVLACVLLCGPLCMGEDQAQQSGKARHSNIFTLQNTLLPDLPVPPAMPGATVYRDDHSRHTLLVLAGGAGGKELSACNTKVYVLNLACLEDADAKGDIARQR